MLVIINDDARDFWRWFTAPQFHRLSGRRRFGPWSSTGLASWKGKKHEEFKSPPFLPWKGKTTAKKFSLELSD